MFETVIFILLGVAAFILINVLLGSYFSYRYTYFLSPKKRKLDPYRAVDNKKNDFSITKEVVDRIVSLPHEDVYIKSHDGLKLHARLYEKDPSAPFIIQCHGYHSYSLIDFCGACPYTYDLGYNVLLIDQRAHGESEGTIITFGDRESRDITNWAKFLNKRYGNGIKIVLYGVSMGAASVILASARDDLPENVKGVFADCPFSSSEGIIRKVITGMNVNVGFAYSLVKLGARLYGNFSPKTSDARAAIAKSKIPTVLVHGDADGYVPYEMSVELRDAANGRVPLHTFEGADHVTSYSTHPERYEKLLSDFYRQCTKDAN